MKGARLRIAGTSRKTRRMVLNAKLSERRQSCACRQGYKSAGSTTIPSRSKRTRANKRVCLPSVRLQLQQGNGNGRASQKPPGLSRRKVLVSGSVFLKEEEAVSPEATLKS